MSVCKRLKLSLLFLQLHKLLSMIAISEQSERLTVDTDIKP